MNMKLSSHGFLFHRNINRRENKVQIPLKVPYCTPFWSFILGFDVLKNIYLRYKYQKTSQYIFTNLGSLEIRVSTYISAKLKKRTYMYDSLQFTVEINTRGSKPLTTFIPFHTKYDLQEQFWLFSHSYLQNGMLWLQNNFNILHDLKTDTFERCHHIYSFICMSLVTQ